MNVPAYSESLGQVAAAAAFSMLLAAACVSDVRARRIPNRLVALLLVGGVLYGAWRGEGAGGLGQSLAAAAVGFAIWVPFYAFRLLGAGDVKLFAAASAWLPPGAVVGAALVAALIGGAVAVAWLVRIEGAALAAARLGHAARQPQLLREPLPVTSPRQRVPYGVVMAAALLFTAWRLHGSF